MMPELITSSSARLAVTCQLPNEFSILLCLSNKLVPPCRLYLIEPRADGVCLSRHRTAPNHLGDGGRDHCKASVTAEEHGHHLVSCLCAVRVLGARDDRRGGDAGVYSEVHDEDISKARIQPHPQQLVLTH